MALTRAMLKAMGIEEEKIDQIIASHSETVEGLKKESAEYRETSMQVPILEKKIQELEAARPTEDWQARYDEVKKEYEDYQAKVDAERADEEKARLYRALLREQGVDEKRIDSIMRVTDLKGVAVKDGALADSEALGKAIADEWGDFIVRTSTKGASVDDPPSNRSGMTREEILEIKDASERQAAIAENIDLFNRS